MSPAQNTREGLGGGIQAFLQIARSNGEMGMNLHLLGKEEKSSSQFGNHVVVPAARLDLAIAIPAAQPAAEALIQHLRISDGTERVTERNGRVITS